MRITVQHALKLPAEREFSSRQHSVAMEVDVPEDVVHRGREAIREYVASVTAEVRSYVERAMGPLLESPRPVDLRTPSRAAPVGRSGGLPRTRAHAGGRGGMNVPAGSGDGQSSNHQSTSVGSPSDVASIKQVNFLRGLAKDAGYSPDELSFLTEEVTGKRDLRALTKREASQMIDQLRNGPR